MRTTSVGLRRGAWTVAAVTGTLLCVVGAVPSGATTTPVGVKTTSLYEFAPSAGWESVSGDRYLAWSQNVASHPRQFNAYLQINSGTPVKLNDRGTLGWGAGIDGTKMIFQQASDDDSQLVLYDIASRTSLPAPQGLNHPASWQW